MVSLEKFQLDGIAAKRLLTGGIPYDVEEEIRRFIMYGIDWNRDFGWLRRKGGRRTEESNTCIQQQDRISCSLG